MSTIITNEIEQYLCELYLKGITYSEMIKLTNVCYSTIYKILKRNGIKFNRRNAQKHNPIKYCIECGDELIIKENWMICYEKRGLYTCNKCTSIMGRDRRRENYLCTSDDNGNPIKIKCEKRNRPEDICEMCEKRVGRLNYHHWNNDHYEFGLWV